jgi:hypothetical protein
MKRGGEAWHDALVSRFNDREDIGKEALYDKFFKDLPKTDVFECLELLEEEYEISPGLLRPEDNLDKLFAPVQTKSPLRWLTYRVRERAIVWQRLITN